MVGSQWSQENEKWENGMGVRSTVGVCSLVLLKSGSYPPTEAGTRGPYLQVLSGTLSA